MGAHRAVAAYKGVSPAVAEDAFVVSVDTTVADPDETDVCVVTRLQVRLSLEKSPLVRAPQCGMALYFVAMSTKLQSAGELLFSLNAYRCPMLAC